MTVLTANVGPGVLGRHATAIASLVTYSGGWEPVVLKQVESCSATPATKIVHWRIRGLGCGIAALARDPIVRILSLAPFEL